MSFDDLRRQLAHAGFSPATTRPPGRHGRSEEVAIRAATLVEHPELRSHAVGCAEPCPDPMAFLDGVQHHQVVGYRGTAPVVAGIAAAAVRLRRDRRLVTRLERTRRVVIARRAALEHLPKSLSGYERLPLEEDDDEHPVRAMDRAVAVLDDARRGLEREVGRAFRQESGAWLIVDGSLAESPEFSQDGRMIGVSTSYATLPFRGPDLDRYLRMPEGHRSSVFEPASRRFAPVYAWGLRLWSWEGRDLLFGLVRVEAARRPETLTSADQWSRWILAERAPVSAPDARWDRLLYGVHNVEDYLRARLPVR